MTESHATDHGRYGAIRRTKPDVFIQLTNPSYFQTDAVFQESGEDTLVDSTGDPVGGVVDPYEGITVASQPTDANRPTYQGLADGASFDGTDDALLIPKDTISELSARIIQDKDDTPGSMAMRVFVDSGTSNGTRIFAVVNDGSEELIQILTDGTGDFDGRFRNQNGNTKIVGEPATNPVDKWFWIFFVKKAEDQEMAVWFDDSLEDTEDWSSSGTVDSFQYDPAIGARNLRGTIDSHMMGKISHWIFWKRAISDTEISNIVDSI